MRAGACRSGKGRSLDKPTKGNSKRTCTSVREEKLTINCHSGSNYDNSHYNDFNCGNWTMEDSVSVVKTFFSTTARAV